MEKTFNTKSGKNKNGGRRRSFRKKSYGRRPRREEGGVSMRQKKIFKAEEFEGCARPEGAFAHLLEDIQNALMVSGYRRPTPIQEQAIPAILKGCDVLGSAQTGTGKTAAFVLPLLDILTGGNHRDRELLQPVAYVKPKPRQPKALILAPTRELADQIGKSIEGYAQFLDITHTVIYGGIGFIPQVRDLEHGVDILVATPGRLLDHMSQGNIDLRELEYFVLDEVDRMLDMGFIPDIKKVLADVPSDRQTLFFSATLSGKVLEVANRLITDPVRITIAPESPAVDRIQQSVYFVDSKNKGSLLDEILVAQEAEKVIIFTQMKHAANRLSEDLSKAGIRATAIHGNKSQGARNKALEGFKKGHFRILVATDVAARGLDVDDITHVINYDLPLDAETYVHRIGRTARAGADGDAISFCSAEERALLHGIERHLKQEVRVEEDHPFHCEKASRSKMAAPKPGGGGRGRGGRRGGHRSKGQSRGGRRFRN